ncbi:hypothetical protein [Pleurocapsa sp. PCC 7327]|uniref:hypothetical protein n=1 Tax=Pleurocapsa sp. PCC 7327 TaxID=118163 RepID=UPI000313792C|nr:hypothetical protein [Pleurocapsa sp. PCC 7327]
MSRLNRKAWKILRAEMEKCTASDRIVGEAWIVTTQKRSIANVEQAKQLIPRSQLCHRSVTKSQKNYWLLNRKRIIGFSTAKTETVRVISQMQFR